MPNVRQTKFVREPRSALDFAFLRELCQAVNALLNMTVTNGRVHLTDSNTVIEIGGNAGALQDFQVVSDGGDYYNCQTFDGVNPGSAIIKVAKHQDLRCLLPTATPAGGAWPSKVIRGITYTYTYAAVTGTTADGVNVLEYTRGVTGSDSSSETNYMTPCLNVGDIITGFSTSFAAPTTLVGVKWQALADGRAWAAPQT